MTNQTIMMITFCVFIPFAITGIILLSRWVYLDAKIRNINPWPWIAIMAVISPNFIGLILYTFVRQKKGGIKCTQCGSEIPPGSSFCPSCGLKLEQPVKQLASPSPVLLIAGFACVTVGFLIILCSYIYNPAIWN